MCFSVDDTPENWELMTEEAHRMVDEWLAWIDEATARSRPRSAPQLAENDRILRETITERDPANQLAVRRYPDGVEEKLVRAPRREGPHAARVRRWTSVSEPRHHPTVTTRSTHRSRHSCALRAFRGRTAPYDTLHVTLTYPALDADPVDKVGTPRPRRGARAVPGRALVRRA